jgi:hypothetical protein
VYSAGREPLGCKRAEILDVVCHQRAAFAARGFENDSVAASQDVLPISDGEHVVTGSAQHHADLWGELLVE